MYLANNTRCEIAFASRQCARFSNNPREPDAKAIIHIALYLNGTKDLGTFITPNPLHMTLDCFVDTDFAGGFTVEDSHDPRSVKSRTGFVITLGKHQSFGEVFYNLKQLHQPWKQSMLLSAQLYILWSH
jgi:hypothetical protein